MVRYLILRTDTGSEKTGKKYKSVKRERDALERTGQDTTEIKRNCLRQEESISSSAKYVSSPRTQPVPGMNQERQT